MTLEQAKAVAVLKDAAPAGKVVDALGVLYEELRRLEKDRDAHLGA